MLPLLDEKWNAVERILFAIHSAPQEYRGIPGVPSVKLSVK